jgi:hypothetical protein
MKGERRGEADAEEGERRGFSRGRERKRDGRGKKMQTMSQEV